MLKKLNRDEATTVTGNGFKTKRQNELDGLVKRISIDFLGSRAQDDRAAGQVHQWISHKTVYILYSSFCVLVHVIIQKPDIG